jgi:membrane protease YdiL (CAAX protease family)
MRVAAASRIPDLAPLLLLGLAAAIRPARLPVLAILVVGFVVLRRREERMPWAGAIPVAVSLAWGLVPSPPGATDGTTCASPTAPFATLRLVETALALGALAGLVRLTGSGAGELGLRRPTRRIGGVAIATFAICGPLGLLLGPLLAEPFFGPIGLDLDGPAALLPATMFAVSNGVMEEIIYRGGLQAWTARRTGVPLAIAGQAIVFGLAHAAGPDVGGAPLVLWAAMTAGGVAAGLIVWRTGSLAIPIAAHVGFDLPLYYGNACRAPM